METSRNCQPPNASPHNAKLATSHFLLKVSQLTQKVLIKPHTPPFKKKLLTEPKEGSLQWHFTNSVVTINFFFSSSSAQHILSSSLPIHSERCNCHSCEECVYWFSLQWVSSCTLQLSFKKKKGWQKRLQFSLYVHIHKWVHHSFKKNDKKVSKE